MNKEIDFKLNQLKLIHYHLDSSDIKALEPIKTSIELKSNYNYEENKLNWIKIITHIYYDQETLEPKANIYQEEVKDMEKLISQLEQNDLRILKNNYFTENIIENSSYWEINYNNYFYIVGTYDQQPQLVQNIINLLDLKKIIKNEIYKINQNEQ